MSELQKETVSNFATGSRYQKIAPVFGDMPGRFKMRDLLRAAKIPSGSYNHMAVALILERDFRCIRVGSGDRKIWKKPGATA